MYGLENAVLGFHGAGWATLPPGSTFGPRTLPDYEFLWMAEGDSVAEWDGNPYPLPPGSLSLITAGTRDFYRWDPKVPTQGVYLHFYFKRRPKALPPDPAWPKVVVLPEGDVLRPLMRHVLWLLDHRTPARLELACGSLRHMLEVFLSGDFQTKAAVTTYLPLAVSEAIRAMTERLARRQAPPTLPELARAAHVSEGHLGRLFRQSLNCGPVEADRLVRIDHAAALLAGSNLPIKEIARLTGFVNPFHFSRCFREVFGLSPRAYRVKALDGSVVPSTRLRAVRTVARPF